VDREWGGLVAFWLALPFLIVGGAKQLGRFGATGMGSEVELVYALHILRLEVEEGLKLLRYWSMPGHA